MKTIQVHSTNLNKVFERLRARGIEPEQLYNRRGGLTKFNARYNSEPIFLGDFWHIPSTGWNVNVPDDFTEKPFPRLNVACPNGDLDQAFNRAWRLLCHTTFLAPVFCAVILDEFYIVNRQEFCDFVRELRPNRNMRAVIKMWLSGEIHEVEGY